MALLAILPVFMCLTLIRAQDETTPSPPNPTQNTIEDNSVDVEQQHMKLYEKIHKYLIKTKAYRNFTFQDTIHHVREGDDWTPTRELQEKFPYYLSGFDYDDQPVWVMEVGKYNYREQIEKGPEAERNLTLYLYQAIHRIFESMIAKDTPDNEIRGIFLIGDCEGLDLLQTAHLPTLNFVLNLLRTNADFVAQMLSHAVFFNMNYVATALFNSFRPILGGAFDKLELYGANKDKWRTVLQKSLPLEAIPTWYGGSKDYKPIQVYG